MTGGGPEGGHQGGQDAAAAGPGASGPAAAAGGPASLNARERWLRTFRFQAVDHVPDEEFGYWTDTLEVWHGQGLPAGIRSDPAADGYFGFARRERVPVQVGVWPPQPARVLEEDDRHRVVVDGLGVTLLEHKDGSSSIPQYLRFPIETRADWLQFRRRLDPEEPGRYPPDWAERVAQWRQRDYPLGIAVGSLFGWLRDWMGFERATTACLEEPTLIEDMMEHLTALTLRAIRRALADVQLDFADFWEDMCFNSGPMISPRLFRRFLVPRYRRITDLLRAHGVDIVYVDCDGDIGELAPLWLEAGVNCMFPLEIRGGTRPEALRARYGRDVLLMGGVDKMALIAGPDAVDRELDRVIQLAEAGGYIPHLDHRCPPDVSFATYLYYLRRKRQLLGIPEPDALASPAVRAAGPPRASCPSPQVGGVPPGGAPAGGPPAGGAGRAQGVGERPVAGRHGPTRNGGEGGPA